jgi:hypothetical protein
LSGGGRPRGRGSLMLTVPPNTSGKTGEDVGNRLGTHAQVWTHASGTVNVQLKRLRGGVARLYGKKRR